ncbi:RICIN domain-containing protein [Streptomyces sp. SID12488]|uniref:RICIN domain-containing protein n=1 Tax=Streptomyces sp. SID12488 TaxID=2706040 RepID=UPI0013DB1EA7|nr:RICIN domain-containing protein [Streptomyces sp. SID12488]NEA69034.1 RICIN domain-containing protein [Streptomyces sp. SID12488]
MRPTLRKRLGGLIATVLLAGAGLAATTTGANAQPASAPAVTPFAGVFHPLKNVGNAKCLQPAGASTVETVEIVQQPCDGSIAQGWQHVGVGGNHYMFLNQLSGYCFNAFDGATDGARLLQLTCKRISNEEFNTGAALPNVVKIESRVGFRDTNFCVDVPGGAATNGLAMQIWNCNGSLAQRWIVGFD